MTASITRALRKVQLSQQWYAPVSSTGRVAVPAANRSPTRRCHRKLGVPDDHHYDGCITLMMQSCQCGVSSAFVSESLPQWRSHHLTSCWFYLDTTWQWIRCAYRPSELGHHDMDSTCPMMTHGVSARGLLTFHLIFFMFMELQSRALNKWQLVSGEHSLVEIGRNCTMDFHVADTA